MLKIGIFKLIVPKINHSPLQAFHIYFRASIDEFFMILILGNEVSIGD
jgi:hypothetical protein